MTFQFNYPSVVKLTTGAKMSVIELPAGVREPPLYTIAPGTAGTAVAVTTTTGCKRGDTVIPLRFAVGSTIPAGSFITVGGIILLTTASAAGTDDGTPPAETPTQVSIRPAPADVVANSTGTYNPGTLTADSRILPIAAAPAIIDTGTILTFKDTAGSSPIADVKVTVTGRTPAGGTQLRIAPLKLPQGTSTFPSTMRATDRLLWAVAGATTLPIPVPEPKEVDTTNLLSGVGMEYIKTALGQTINFSLDIRDGDLGGELIAEHGRTFEKLAREIYFETVFADGEKHEGAGMVTSVQEGGELQNKRTLEVTIRVQGETYEVTKPTSNFY